jgi:hypothetical protein
LLRYSNPHNEYELLEKMRGKMGTVVDGDRGLAGQRPKHWPMATPRIEEMMERLMALLGQKIDEYTGPSLSTKEFLACTQALEAERDRIGGLEAKIDQSGYEAQAVHVTEMSPQSNEYLLNGDRKEHTVLIATRNKGSPLKALFMQSASPTLTIWIFQTRPLRPYRRLNTMGRFDRLIADVLSGEYELRKEFYELFGGEIKTRSLLAESLRGTAAFLDEIESRREPGCPER